MKGNRILSVALACLLTLSLTACGNENPQQERDVTQETESGPAAGAMQETEDNTAADAAENAIQSEPAKDEPALDWSAVETAPEEDFTFSSVSIGPQASAIKGAKIKEYLGEGGVVKIPGSYQGMPVLMIDNKAFTETNVTDVYFEAEDFVYVQTAAFQDCTSLNSVVIKGNEQTEIREWAFAGCTSLTSVVLSKEITKFGEYTFRDTPWLENKKQQDPLVIVNNVVLDGMLCTGDIVIPDGVVRIGPGAFNGNTNITNVTLPDSIRHIEFYAFASCTSLKSVNIPDDTSSIDGIYGFAGCENVVLTYQGKKYSCEKLEELESLLRSQ